MTKTEINDIETEKATEKMNITRSWIFEKINKNWQSSSKTDQKREKTQITNIKNEMGDTTTDPEDI